MKRLVRFSRGLTSVLLAGVATLFLASSMPHQHADGSAAQHAPSACQLCSIQQRTGATPTAAVATASIAAPVVAPIVHIASAPRAVPFLRASAPRSPPVIS